MGLGLGWAVGSPASRQAHEILWPGAPEASGPRPGFGGWWFLIVARPLYIALLLAWVWRLALVIVLLWRSARLHLALVPTHPDRAGGLGFLEELPFAFSPFLLALSSVSAARWAHDFLYHGVPVETLTWPLALFLVVVLGLFLTPLAVFGPPLVAAKHRALLE